MKELVSGGSYKDLLRQRVADTPEASPAALLTFDTATLDSFSPVDLELLAGDLPAVESRVPVLRTMEVVLRKLLHPTENEQEVLNAEPLSRQRLADALTAIIHQLGEMEELGNLEPTMLTTLMALPESDDFEVRRAGLTVLPELFVLDERRRIIAPERVSGYREQVEARMLALAERLGRLPLGLSEQDNSGEHIDTGFSPQAEERLEALVDVFHGYYPNRLVQLAVRGMEKTENPAVVSEWFRILSERFSVNETLAFLMSARRAFPEKAAALDRIERTLGLNPGKAKRYTPEESYAHFNLDEHEAYDEKVFADELRLISGLVGETGAGKHLHDAAMGHGRHLVALRTQFPALVVSGTDAAAANVQVAQRQLPGVDVREAGWDNTGLPDASVDVYLNIGRSILHNGTVGEMIACLHEAARILKPDGKGLVDVAATEGHYSEAPDRLLGLLEQHGVAHRVEPGTVVDTPDGEHAFHRFNPGEIEQFKALCKMAGLDATLIEEQPFYYGEQRNVNRFWEIKKCEQPLSWEEWLQYSSLAVRVKPQARVAIAY